MSLTSPPRTRSRLSPEARRAQFLDEAAKLVLAEGVSAVSMERLAREVGASRALAYTYFQTPTDLMRALLVREYDAFQEKGRRLMGGAKTLDAIVRATTQAWIDHILERGELIQRLMHEPDIVSALDEPVRMGRSRTVAYFGDAIARVYAIAPARAYVIVELLMGLTGAAGTLAKRQLMDRAQLADLAVQLIFGALESVREDHSA